MKLLLLLTICVILKHETLSTKFSRRNGLLESQGFGYRTKSYTQRTCQCPTVLMCSCCEMVTLVYNYGGKKLCLNFRYEDAGLSVDLSLDSNVFQNTTITVYKPFEMRAAVPGCRFSRVSAQILELNKFPQSLTICPRLDITGKKSRWQITYTCISLSTTIPQQSGPGTPPSSEEEEEEPEEPEEEANFPVVMMVVPMPIRQPQLQQNVSVPPTVLAQNQNSPKPQNAALTIKLPPGKKKNSSNTSVHHVLSLPALTAAQIAQIPKGNLSEVIKILLQRSTLPLVSTEQLGIPTVKITTSKEESHDQSSSPEQIDFENQASHLFELLAEKFPLHKQAEPFAKGRMSGKVKIVSEQSKESFITINHDRRTPTSPIYKCSQVHAQVEKMTSSEHTSHFDQATEHSTPAGQDRIGQAGQVPVIQTVNITASQYGIMENSPLTKLHPVQPETIHDYLSLFGQPHLIIPNSTKQVFPNSPFQMTTMPFQHTSLDQIPITRHHLIFPDQTKSKDKLPSHLPQAEDLSPAEEDSEEITLSVQVKVPSKNPPTLEDATKNMRLINLKVSTTIRETSEKMTGNKTGEINDTSLKDFAVLLRERNNNSDAIVPRRRDNPTMSRSESSGRNNSSKVDNVRRNRRMFRKRQLDFSRKSSRIVNIDSHQSPVVTKNPLMLSSSTSPTSSPDLVELLNSTPRPTPLQLSNSEVEDLLTISAHVIRDYESVEGVDVQNAQTTVYNRADIFPQRTPPLIGAKTESIDDNLNIYQFIQPKIKYPSAKTPQVHENTNIIFPDN